MIKYCWMWLILLGFSGCMSRNYNPDQLSVAQQEETLYEMVRYFGKLPKKGADHDNKFEEKFDPYYKLHAKEHELIAYHKTSEGKEFFLLKKVAPSRFEKYFATGIEAVRNDNGEIIHYNEVFRTWRLAEPEFTDRSMLLFDKMAKGEDLSPYYTHNSVEEYIEFPDKTIAFDTISRRWLNRSLMADN
ncbi:hypothetical protein [Anditalea andensis]|uniref:Lipoprotein n=1 Tax=Anditalea andensis TaxID=1048983 RepID=A0A074KX55_9BACT|nr:hypothetical protein [Anditalea andensis]KEO72168.1 hypothetical protein EL17_19875 [Anditalea andensis]